MVKSVYQVGSAIRVFSREDAELARTQSGDLTQALPQIVLTAEFNGKWDSKESMDSDLHECLDGLLRTYGLRMSCTQDQCSND